MPPKAKPDTAAYQKLKKDIKEGTIGTLYVFHGEEAYLRDFYLGQLKKKLLPAGMEEFNLHTLSGKEFDVKTLAQLVDCLPMMSERTLIVVNDYDIYKGDKDALAAVLRELPDYVCLVFVYDLIEYKADARTKLAALLKEKGSVVPFNRQGQGDLVDWISRRFKAMDHDIGTEDAKYLIFLCGDLMNNLISEIGKIGSYAAHHRVTRQDIDAVATPQLDAVVFQMTDAIAAGNFDKAAEVLGELLHMQEAPIKLLAVLGKQLRQLYTARLAIEHRKGVPYLMELWGMRSAAEEGELDAGALGPVPLDGAALESVRMEDGAAVLSLRGEKAAAWLSSEPLDRLGVYSVPWRGSARPGVLYTEYLGSGWYAGYACLGWG